MAGPLHQMCIAGPGNVCVLPDKRLPHSIRVPSSKMHTGNLGSLLPSTPTFRACQVDCMMSLQSVCHVFVKLTAATAPSKVSTSGPLMEIPMFMGSSHSAPLRYAQDEGLRRRQRIEQCPFCPTSPAPHSQEGPDRRASQWPRERQRGQPTPCPKQLWLQRGWCAGRGHPPAPLLLPRASVKGLFSSKREPPPFHIRRKGQSRCLGQKQI